ncbi:oxidoreductase [Chiua virens]|nr:oxidoreductase [Chiua virens]
MSPINVGFVGLSATGWARVLAPALQTLGDTYRIVAVSTTNETSAIASAQRLSEETKYPVKAYFAKKSFYIEWPAGRNLQETKELAEAARQNGVRSIVGLQGRQSPVLNKAKELIASGKIGKVLSCSVIAGSYEEMGFFGPLVKQSNVYTTDSSSGASLLEIAVGHHVDTLLYVLGSEISTVSATTTTIYPTVAVTQDDGMPTGETVTSSVPDHVAFSGTLANGALISVCFRGGYKSAPGRHQLVWIIDGETGSIRVENAAQGGAFTQIHAPKLYLDGEEITGRLNQLFDGSPEGAVYRVC